MRVNHAAIRMLRARRTALAGEPAAPSRLWLYALVGGAAALLFWPTARRRHAARAARATYGLERDLGGSRRRALRGGYAAYRGALWDAAWRRGL